MEPTKYQINTHKHKIIYTKRMTNECYNRLTIIGPEEDLHEIYMNRLDFDYYVPMPQNSNNPDKWCIDNWGTQWVANPDTIQFELSANWLQIRFETSWSAPYVFLEKLLDIYPNCWIKNESISDDYRANIYILYKKDGIRKEKILVWNEPEPRLTIHGEIYVPEED